MKHYIFMNHLAHCTKRIYSIEFQIITKYLFIASWNEKDYSFISSLLFKEKTNHTKATNPIAKIVSPMTLSHLSVSIPG